MFSEIRSQLALQCILTIGLAFGETGSDIKDVKRLLFTTQKYDKKIRPMKDQLRSMNVNVYFKLKSIIDFDEENETFKTTGVLFLCWTDEYLQWNMTEFNSTYSIFLPQDDIWKPDIILGNSIASFTGLGSPYLNIFVTYEGDVTWYPYQVFQSTCDVDMLYFPFDVQTCKLNFTAWTYTKGRVTFHPGFEGIDLSEYTPNSMWDIHYTAGREFDTSDAEFAFEITLKRKPGFYIINIIVPIILLSILNSFSFVLPITSGERASFSVTVFLSLAVFLTIVASSLPKNSDSVSFLSVYLIFMTALSTVTVVLCLMEARIASRNTTEHAIGNGFLTVHKLALILRCKICRHTRVQSTSSRSFGDVNWIDIVDSMDVLLFIFFMTLTVLSVVVIFAIAASQWAIQK